MQLIKREVIQSMFLELLEEFINEKLGRYSPRLNVFPIPERDDLEVPDTTWESLYHAILQFAQTVARVSNMQLFKREVIQSMFLELLEEFINEKLGRYSPRLNVFPIPERDDLEVPIAFEIAPRPVYLFGVKDNSQARLVTISCQIGR